MCSHTEYEWIEYEEEDWYGIVQIETKCVEVSLQEDIDLHRFKCKRCGEIGYYSGAAKNYFENGILSPVKGLN